MQHVRDAVGKDELWRINCTYHWHERSCGTDAYMLRGCHGITVMVKPTHITNSLHSRNTVDTTVTCLAVWSKFTSTRDIDSAGNATECLPPNPNVLVVISSNKITQFLTGGAG